MPEVIERMAIYNIYCYKGAQSEYKGEYMGYDATDALKRFLGDKYQVEHVWYTAARVK